MSEEKEYTILDFIKVFGKRRETGEWERLGFPYEYNYAIGTKVAALSTSTYNFSKEGVIRDIVSPHKFEKVLVKVDATKPTPEAIKHSSHTGMSIDLSVHNGIDTLIVQSNGMGEIRINGIASPATRAFVKNVWLYGTLGTGVLRSKMFTCEPTCDHLRIPPNIEATVNYNRRTELIDIDRIIENNDNLVIQQG